jgi:hypothetical protein
LLHKIKRRWRNSTVGGRKIFVAAKLKKRGGTEKIGVQGPGERNEVKNTPMGGQ